MSESMSRRTSDLLNFTGAEYDTKSPSVEALAVAGLNTNEESRSAEIELRLDDSVEETRLPDCPPLAESLEGVLIDDLPKVELKEDRLRHAEAYGNGCSHTCPGSSKNHEVGAHGEIAVAEFYDEWESLDHRIYENRGDDGLDLKLAGCTVDVKTTRSRSPRLRVSEGKVRANRYFLVRQESKRHYRLIGYGKENCVRKSPVKYWNGKDVHEVPSRYIWSAPKHKQNIA